MIDDEEINAEIIKEKDIFKNTECSLKEASKDDNGKTEEYMVESELSVFNFDKVKDKYIKDLSLSEKPKSADAFFINQSGEMFLIEFKNGKIEKKVPSEIRLKMFDSLLLLTYIIGITASCTRKKLSFILVYNEEKNPNNISKEEEVQESPSRTKIGKHFAKKAKEEFIRFGLKRFEKLYFKNVCTTTLPEFKERFASGWQVSL